ncbi:MAG: AI-2E family transporter, partial [Pseudomonadota bacterium]
SVTAMWMPIREYVSRYEWGREVLAMIGDPGIAADRVSAIGKLLAAVFGGVSGLIVSVIIGLYIAADPQLYRRGLLRLTPLRVRAHAADILDQLHETLRSWLLGTLLLMVVVGTLITLGLWAIGIPLALALGLIAFILEFIPYVGPIVAALPALLVAAGVGSREVVLVLLLYWAVQSLEGYILAPLVYQKRVHIPPMITISAQVVLGTLLGILGVIFATPLTACFMVLTQRLYVEDALGDDMTRPLQANSERR